MKRLRVRFADFYQTDERGRLVFFPFGLIGSGRLVGPRDTHRREKAALAGMAAVAAASMVLWLGLHEDPAPIDEGDLVAVPGSCLIALVLYRLYWSRYPVSTSLAAAQKAARALVAANGDAVFRLLTVAFLAAAVAGTGGTLWQAGQALASGDPGDLGILSVVAMICAGFCVNAFSTWRIVQLARIGT